MKKTLLFIAVFLAVFLLLPAATLPILSQVTERSIGLVEFAVIVTVATVIALWVAKKATAKI